MRNGVFDDKRRCSECGLRDYFVLLKLALRRTDLPHNQEQVHDVREDCVCGQPAYGQPAFRVCIPEYVVDLCNALFFWKYPSSNSNSLLGSTPDEIRILRMRIEHGRTADVASQTFFWFLKRNPLRQKSGCFSRQMESPVASSSIPFVAFGTRSHRGETLRSRGGQRDLLQGRDQVRRRHVLRRGPAAARERPGGPPKPVRWAASQKLRSGIPAAWDSRTTAREEMVDSRRNQRGSPLPKMGS